MTDDRNRWGAAEWLRVLRGWPAYVLCIGLPLWRWPRVFLWLLPYAGDWLWRHERRAVLASDICSLRPPVGFRGAAGATVRPKHLTSDRARRGR